jgi:tetratricopeptide (TPR) repeat protein
MYNIIKARADADWWQVNQSYTRCKKYFYEYDPLGEPIDWYEGDAKMNEKKYQSAKRYFYQALKKNEFQPEIWNDLTASFENLNQIDSAKICNKKILELIPNHPLGIFNKSAIYFDENKFDSAKLELNKFPFKDLNIYKDFEKQIDSTFIN